MTTKQRIHLMAELWPNACQAQKWNRNDRELRLRVLSQAVGRPLKSASDINERDEFDAVKRHLLTLADNVSGAMRTPAGDEARRTMTHVRELLRCLELYHDEPGIYVRTLLRGIKRGARVEIGGVEDLGVCLRTATDGTAKISELEQFRRTLNARINGKTGLRNQAGHSLHDMRLKAGLVCGCSICAPRGAVLVNVGSEELEEVLAHSEEEEPF